MVLMKLRRPEAVISRPRLGPQCDVHCVLLSRDRGVASALEGVTHTVRFVSRCDLHSYTLLSGDWSAQVASVEGVTHTVRFVSRCDRHSDTLLSGALSAQVASLLRLPPTHCGPSPSVTFTLTYRPSRQLVYRAATKLLHPCLSLASLWMVPQLWFVFFISASKVLRQVVFRRPRFRLSSRFQ